MSNNKLSYATILGTKEVMSKTKQVISKTTLLHIMKTFDGLVTVDYVRSLVNTYNVVHKNELGNTVFELLPFIKAPLLSSTYVNSFIIVKGKQCYASYGNEDKMKSLKFSLRTIDHLIDNNVFSRRKIKDRFKCKTCLHFPKNRQELLMLCPDCDYTETDCDTVLYNIDKNYPLNYTMKNNIKNYDLSINTMKLRTNPILINMVEKYHISYNHHKISDKYLEQISIYYLPPDIINKNFYEFSHGYIDYGDEYDDGYRYNDDTFIPERFSIKTDHYEFHRKKILDLEILFITKFLNLYFPNEITNIIISYGIKLDK